MAVTAHPILERIEPCPGDGRSSFRPAHPQSCRSQYALPDECQLIPSNSAHPVEDCSSRRRALILSNHPVVALLELHPAALPPSHPATSVSQCPGVQPRSHFTSLSVLVVATAEWSHSHRRTTSRHPCCPARHFDMRRLVWGDSGWGVTVLHHKIRGCIYTNSCRFQLTPVTRYYLASRCSLTRRGKAPQMLFDTALERAELWKPNIGEWLAFKSELESAHP